MRRQQSPSGRSGAEKWQHLVSSAYFPLEIESGAHGSFNGKLDVWPLGPVCATRITCDPVLYRRNPRHLRDERESSLLISVPSVAEVTFRQNGRQARCRPGGFVVERGDAPYEYWHGTPDVQWVVKVPRDGVRARIGNAERFLGLSFDARRGLASYFLTSLHAALRHAGDMDAAARGMAGAHLLEILCLALREDEHALESARTTVRRAHLHRAEAFIRANLKRPDLDPGHVAEACGISLRYLQRLFAETDMTVAGYIRDCRLTRCDEELQSRPGETIATIAYRWGFSDQAQFSRAYRAQFGRSPRAARRAAQSSSGSGAP
jgi:AraC-like DNA-binding protein